MSETYNFYVQMDGQVFGPYTAQEVRNLELTDDILVTEDSMDGQWLPASRFDFDDMVKKEKGETTPPFKINTDGTVMVPTSKEPSTSEDYDPDNVPDEIKKWNWGAFFFVWIWGVCNGVYWPLALILLQFIPYIGGVILLVGAIVLGINGNKLAWENKHWDSLEHFKRIQHNWAIACLWVLGGILLICFIALISES